MSEEEGVSQEAFQTLADLAELRLSEQELAELKPAYDFVRSEAEKLRERDISAVEPASTFSPDWRYIIPSRPQTPAPIHEPLSLS